METEFFMRWKENGQSYYKVLKRKDMQEKFASTFKIPTAKRHRRRGNGKCNTMCKIYFF